MEVTFQETNLSSEHLLDELMFVHLNLAYGVRYNLNLGC